MKISFTPYSTYFLGNINDPKPKKNPKDFDVIQPDVSELDIQTEAKRCLQCKTPRCVAACPNGNNIPLFIYYAKIGDWQQAGEASRSTQPLPSCARVCFHDCEDACVRGIKSEPLKIHLIERFIGDNTEDKPVTAVPSGKKVAIIGGGPAGIAAAKELIKNGHEVHIFDSNPKLGGVLRYGIPSFRLPEQAYQKEIDYLERNGVIFHLNTQVGVDVRHKDLKGMGIDAIFICSGAGKPRKLDISGEDLTGVLSSQTFLKRVRMAESKDELYDIGKKVIIIGGGNVAMDCARNAIRLAESEYDNKDVTIVYRRSENEMPARRNEIEDAKEEGANFKFLLSPVKILSQYEMNNPERGLSVDKVGGVKFEKMELSEPDESGRSSIKPTGEFIIIEADTVINALGSMPKSVIKESFEKDGIFIQSDRKGQVAINQGLNTNVDGIFAGGDVAPKQNAPLTMTHAIAAGRQAAKAINDYLASVSDINV